TLVVDWGLAKASGVASAPRVNSEGSESIERFGGANATPLAGDDPTAVGSVLGTPAYMPPEQAEGRVDELGPASDIYSLGAILYAILTGKPPVSGHNLAE